MAVTGDPRSMIGVPTAPPPLPNGMATLAQPYAARSSFTFAAPTPTPYGDFTAPNPADIANDPAYQFRAAEGQRAIEHSAASKGTLLSGGLLRSLERYRQGLASTETDNAFNRALQTYDTNRATNQQNFGQGLASFTGNLDAFRANDASARGWASLDPSAPTTPSVGPVLGGPGGPLTTAPGLSGGGLADYAAMVANDRANAAESARIRGPVARTPTPWMTPERRGAIA